jgi:hypothetical protein
MRKKTFLSEEAWMTIPFSETPKTPFHQMLDILLLSPELMDRAEQLGREQVPERKLRLCLEMVDTCWKLDERMEAFYSTLEYTISGQLYWHSESSYGPLDQYPFSTKLEFIDSGVGVTITLWWAALVLLWSGMCELYELIDTIMAQGQVMKGRLRPADTWPDFDAIACRIQLRPLGHRSQFITPAQNVCRAVEFLMNDDISLAVLLAPLSMIAQVLPAWPGFESEVQWARVALGKIRQRGVELARYFPEQVVILARS